jgi:hypothetical protein
MPEETVGLCECGCGETTTLNTRTNGKYRKGEYSRFVLGHFTRGKKMAAKLKVSEVRRIKKKLAQKRYTHAEIGRLYGVSKGCVYSIAKGDSWKEVEAA